MHLYTQHIPENLRHPQHMPAREVGMSRCKSEHIVGGIQAALHVSQDANKPCYAIIIFALSLRYLSA